ncbi:DUF2628 domain-containing protein [Pontiella agarivorans]|uniref:DUF2628 domain-containing protein n=1 Tax=Pontiella agarivorans TaxID=3038953 RepID=A0ABU5N1L8_9BACT|nr:DUF2628 domain-containing protein [Pontiella agarivorans]MDZ8120322.1 DUF2628 domain-containing protein [Pontiella agarivorans]
MNIYRIYEHEEKRQETVKVGFLWFAFFFGWLWALTQGLFKCALKWFLISLTISVVAQVISRLTHNTTMGSIFNLAALIVLWIWIGNIASRRKEAHLVKKGYKLIYESEAGCFDEAMSSFRKQQIPE